MNNIINTVIFNNSVYNYLISLAIIIGGIIIVKIFKFIFIKRIPKIFEKHPGDFTNLLAQVLNKRIFPLIYLVLVYIAVNRLYISNVIHKSITIILLVLFTIFSILLIQDVLIYLIKKYWQKKDDFENKDTILNLVIIIIKVITWIIGGLFILDNLEVKITGLITGLGIGGIAVAFAAQTILADIFSYFTIFIDRPFDIGDFIIIGDYKGTVQHIGIKTTRIRSLSGEQLIFSNNDLTNSRINNYTRMERRRINFTFGVNYQTDIEKLEKIPEIVENIISSLDKLTFDRTKFFNFGDYSLIYDVVYFVEDSDYQFYMKQQEKINLALKRKFKEEKIEFAYPTQSVYLQEDKIEDKDMVEPVNIIDEKEENEADDRA